MSRDDERYLLLIVQEYVYVLGKTQIQSNLKSDEKFQSNLNLTRQILGMEFEPWPIHVQRKFSSKIKKQRLFG